MFLLSLFPFFGVVNTIKREKEKTPMKSNKLAACIKLAHKVTVYVPGTVGAAAAGDTSEWIARAASLLSSRFGGATSSPADGL